MPNKYVLPVPRKPLLNMGSSAVEILHDKTHVGVMVAKYGVA